jgi:SpoVK/Ycf46/Vps4 family AAA+-type ATPase
MESQLSEMFEMASHWKALLLLDEADVFVAERTDSLQHNALVVTFLRTLEYYQGVMFLTTNRVKAIDPAISSRIHVKVKYDDLTEEARLKVWSNFFRKLLPPDQQLSAREMRRLAQHDMNGREVRCPFLPFTCPLACASKLTLATDQKYCHGRSLARQS